MVAIKSLFAAAALSIATPALGRVTNFFSPSTGTVGQNITVQLTSYSYIQNWEDYGVIFGLSRPEYACDRCVGTQIAYFDFTSGNYSHINSAHGNTSFSLPISEYQTPGDYILVAAIPHLVGASGSTSFSYFNHTISIVNTTSSS